MRLFILYLTLYATASGAGGSVTMPDTWPTVFARSVSAAEARQLNIHILDRCGALGSFPYQVCTFFGMRAKLKQYVVSLGSLHFEEAPDSPLFGAWPVQSPYDLTSPGMDRWFVVEHNKVMERLLPGFRFYISPAATLVLFRDCGDSTRRFGPRDTLCTDFIAALRQSGNQMRVGDLLELAQLELFIKGAFEDWAEHGCIPHDWKKDWLDSAPRLPVFTGLILKRAWTDTAPDRDAPARDMKRGEPHQVYLLFNPLWWPTREEVPSHRWPPQHGDTWALQLVPYHPREPYEPDVFLVSNGWRVQSFERPDWDILERTFAVLRTIAGPYSGLVDSLYRRTYYPLSSALWSWVSVNDNAVRRPTRTLLTLQYVVLALLGASVLAAIIGLTRLLTRFRRAKK